jgi:hypothetical protein
MSDSRAASTQTLHFNSQKALPFKRRGFFVLALKSKNQEQPQRGYHSTFRPPAAVGRAGGITQKGDGQDLKKLI